MTRSFLFVPADSERKLQKAAAAGADALIVDLEDSVAANARPDARILAREFLAGKENVWVRINPVDTDDAVADLEAVMPSAPAGIVLPKPHSAAAAIELDKRIATLESLHGIEAGQTKILPLCTEHPEALFTLNSYRGSTPRLAGLSWGAEDLSAALGAMANRDAEWRMVAGCMKWHDLYACWQRARRRLLLLIRFSLISKTAMACDDMQRMPGVTDFRECWRFTRHRLGSSTWLLFRQGKNWSVPRESSNYSIRIRAQERLVWMAR